MSESASTATTHAADGAPPPAAGTPVASASEEYVSPGAAQPDLWTSGILAALQPGVAACDEQIAGVFAAQTELATHIDRLTAAAQSFHAVAKPDSLAPYTNKLIASKKRIKKSQSDIAKIAARLDDIRQLVRKKENIATPKPAAAAGPAAGAPTTILDKLKLGLGGAQATTSKDASPNLSRSTSTSALGPATVAATPTEPAATPATPADAPASADPATTAATPADSGAAPTAASETPADSATPGPTTARVRVTSLLNWEDQGPTR